MNDLYISAEEAFEQLENEAVLIDIRETFEVENVWIDRDDVWKLPYSTFGQGKADLPQNKKLILCCAVGLVSEDAVLQLKKDGYNAVYVLKDGLVGWKQANLPLKTMEEAACKCKCCKE